MSDLYALLDALNHADSAQIDAVLATVVKVEGSAYRRPGARMLIPLLVRSLEPSVVAAWSKTWPEKLGG